MLTTTLSYAAEKRADDIKQKAPIIVNGDRVEYFHEQKKVIGTGNVFIDYEDVRLTCEKVTVYLDTREAIAEGDVKITQKDTYFTGDKINYNFDTRIGKAVDAYINYTPFYGRWNEIGKAGEKLIDIRKGHMTTCDLKAPHYRVEARKVEIYLDDKVIARDVVFRIGNVPVMYLPFYYQPIKDESAHITLEPGHDRDWGYYVLMSMKYDVSDIYRGRYRFDYRTKDGYAFGVDNLYKLPGLGDGIVKFYHAQDHNKYFTWKRDNREEGKYRLQIRHKWQVTDDTLFTLELNKVRDDNMMKYFFYNEWREQQQPDNFLSFVKTAPEFTTTFLYRQRLDKYYTVVQRQPEFTIDIPKFNIKWFDKPMPLYYDMKLSSVFLNRTYAENNQLPTQKDEQTARVDFYNRLTYTVNPIKQLRSLNFSPYAGMRQTYYSRGIGGDTNMVRGLFDAGMDSSIKFYRIYDVKTNFLWLDINKLRHVVTPTASYYFNPQPTIDRHKFFQMDGIDALKDENGIRMAVESRLQTKRAGQSASLAWFMISTDYKFKLKKGVFAMNENSDYKQRKFQSVDMQLELTPYPWLYALSKMRINTKHALPEQASIDFVAGKEEDRSMAFGYRYEKSFDSGVPANTDDGGSTLNYFTADGIYRFNEKWLARVYWRYNMNKGYIDEHQYTISRDLHCWLLDFTYDFRPYEDNKTISTQTFWIALRLKAFPKMPLGIGRSYSRTRAGNPGEAGFLERQSVSAGRSTGY
jgi:LPS-assembly protein